MDGLLASPVLGVSIDEKGRYLGVIVRYLTNSFVPRAVLLAYRELEGLDSADLSRLLLSILAENNVDLDSIVSFAADGASVMGTRAAFSDSTNNVVRYLRGRISKPFLVTHCAAHRAQLAIAAAYGDDDYLKDLEGRLRSVLFKNLRGKNGADSATMDFVFRSEVSGEEMLNSLGTAQARWLSMLQPVLTAAPSKVSCMVGVRGAGPIGKSFSVSVGARKCDASPIPPFSLRLL